VAHEITAIIIVPDDGAYYSFYNQRFLSEFDRAHIGGYLAYLRHIDFSLTQKSSLLQHG
jgi:hypothetical protein